MNGVGGTNECWGVAQDGNLTPMMVGSVLAAVGPVVSKGFLNDNWRDALGLVGTIGVVATFVGLLVALVQLRRTRGAAEAAKAAAVSARRSLASNLRLSDLTSASRRVSEIRTLILVEQSMLAGGALSELRALLVQINVADLGGPSETSDLQGLIAQLASWETALAREGLSPAKKKVDPLKILRTLQEVSDRLIELGASARLRTGGTDADS